MSGDVVQNEFVLGCATETQPGSAVFGDRQNSEWCIEIERAQDVPVAIEQCQLPLA